MLPKNQPLTIFWFRRDLRLYDNVGFYYALKSEFPVLPVFIFDTEILQSLPKNDARVSFIHQKLTELRIDLQKNGSSLAVFNGKPLDVFKQLVADFNIQQIITNHDYEPYAIKRDHEIANFLQSKNIEFSTYKDQVVFEKAEIVKDDGKPYMVYTPYSKKWLSNVKNEDIATHPSEENLKNCIQNTNLPFLSPVDIGFSNSKIQVPDYTITSKLINEYETKRNFPSEDATSKLSVHLRFGTVSIRQLVKEAIKSSNNTFLKELIWREFFMQILWHFPHTITKSFKEKYNSIKWRNDSAEFEKWKAGKTGFPMVDAGMRQLNKTGWMHNRVRMITASFLCKHLLIDWRWGEAYFAEKLLDYEMASNIGNWQWVAGCGVDAAPYFRIFNPHTQLKKFDENLNYVKKWVEDFNELSYPTPMINHQFARERCLKMYKVALTPL